jgi:hypothetical protein
MIPCLLTMRGNPSGPLAGGPGSWHSSAMLRTTALVGAGALIASALITLEEGRMPYMVARDRFDDYAQWRRVWDAGAAARQAAGLESAQLFRSPDAPNEIVILCEVESVPEEGD